MFQVNIFWSFTYWMWIFQSFGACLVTSQCSSYSKNVRNVLKGKNVATPHWGPERCNLCNNMHCSVLANNVCNALVSVGRDWWEWCLLCYTLSFRMVGEEEEDDEVHSDSESNTALTVDALAKKWVCKMKNLVLFMISHLLHNTPHHHHHHQQSEWTVCCLINIQARWH